MPLREPRAATTTTTSAAGTTFARRHPILCAFGVLAGLSLFAAYFPVSAIVTAVAVGVHASGADRAGLRAVRRLGAAALQRWRARHPSHAPAEPGGTQRPAPPGPQPRSIGALDSRSRTVSAAGRAAVTRGVTHPRATRRAGEPPVAAGVEREVDL